MPAPRAFPLAAVLIAVLAAALGAISGGSAAAAPRNSATALLTRPTPPPRATASGTVRIRFTERGHSLDVRAVGLDRRAGYALRLDQTEPFALVATKADKRGKARFRFRSDRAPEGTPAVLANRPVEIVEWTAGSAGDLAAGTAGQQVLKGRIPTVSGYESWTDPSGGGGGGGGGGGPTTRLAGVDGDGPFAVTSATFSLPTATGGLAPGSSVVWYPGSGATVSGTGTYPPVVLVHAFQLQAADYAGWAQKIASWGFVVLVLDHTDPLLTPDNEKEVRTTLGGIDWLVAQNADMSSRFFGRLDVQKFGLVGHSLGGGAAIVAATRAASGGRVKAAVGLAPAALSTTTFSPTFPFLPVTTSILPDTTTGLWPATLTVSGSQDITVTAATAKGTYFTPAPAGRAFLRIDRHCHLHYADNIPQLAQLGSDYNPLTCTTQASQLQEARIYVVPWLMWHLQGDARVTDYVDGTYAAEQANAAERLFQ